jgi:hypothetical protein
VHRKTFKKYGGMSELHDAFMWSGENYLLKVRSTQSSFFSNLYSLNFVFVLVNQMRRDLVFLDHSPCVRQWLGLPIEGLCPPFLVYSAQVPSAEARLQGR